MKHTQFPLICFLFFSWSLLSVSSYAIDSKALEEQANTTIKELYHRLDSKPITSMTERIDWFSQYFLNSNYILGSLGEGPGARYDQFPQYRVDGFDCETYVTTILSLATANSLNSFQHCLKYTRYHNGNMSYINRNHITSIDWNKNNQIRGLLKDITLTIKDQHNHPVAVFASTLINKPQWYAHKTIDTIRLQQDDSEQQKKRLAELKEKGSHLKSSVSRTPYLPFSALFSKDNTPNLYLFSQIPDAAIIEIVRPNWDLRQQIGTALNISHLGFAIWKDKQLYFREASSHYGKVVDVLLIDYLKTALNSPTIKGINVQIVLPKKTSSGNCRSFLPL